MLLGNNHLGNILAKVITIRTLPQQSLQQFPTPRVNFEGRFIIVTLAYNISCDELMTHSDYVVGSG